METFVAQFAGWKSCLSRISELNEQQLVLNMIQNLLQQTFENWTYNRMRIESFGVKKCSTGITNQVQKLELATTETNESDFEDDIMCEPLDAEDSELLHSNVSAGSDIEAEEIDIAVVDIDELYAPKIIEPNAQPTTEQLVKKTEAQEEKSDVETFDDIDNEEMDLTEVDFDELPAASVGEFKRREPVRTVAQTKRSTQTPRKTISKEKRRNKIKVTHEVFRYTKRKRQQSHFMYEVIRPKPEDVQYFCYICNDGVIWNTRSAYAEHFTDRHLVRREEKWEIACHKCKQLLTHAHFGEILVRLTRHHMKQHGMQRPAFMTYYKCTHHTDCNVTSFHAKGVTSHIRSWEGTRYDPGRAVCDRCNKTVKRTSLPQHKKTCGVSLETRARIGCPSCKMMFLSQKALQLHVARKHDNVKNFVCPTCDMQFFLKNDLIKHVWLRHKENLSGKPLVKCEVCEHVTLPGTVMQQHALKHSNQVLECPVCQTTFNRKDTLRQHLKVVHGLPKPLARKRCPFCSYTAKSNFVLKRHVRNKHHIDQAATGPVRGALPTANHPAPTALPTPNYPAPIFVTSYTSGSFLSMNP